MIAIEAHPMTIEETGDPEGGTGPDPDPGAGTGGDHTPQEEDRVQGTEEGVSALGMTGDVETLQQKRRKTALI